MDTRDIIWVTLESVRQDRTTLSGHARNTTPFLRRLAESPDGTPFSNCVSHAIWTRPSTASILSGLAPSNHRVWSYEAALSDDVETIPQQLRERGYRTAGVSPIAQVSAATGLDNGFDEFHYLGKKQLIQEAGLIAVLRFLANLRKHSAGFTRNTKKHSRGFLTKAVAHSVIDRAADEEEPLFLYVHIGDSHHAYYPPGGWQDIFADELQLSLDDALDVALDMASGLHEHLAREVPFNEAEWNALEVLYDTCLRYVDSLLESIVKRARAQLDDPLVVVTADHGEFLGELNLISHMLSTHSAVTDVPLVVSGLEVPDGIESGLVQHADVMTMLSADLDLDLDVPIGRDVRNEPRDFTVTQRGPVRPQKKLAKIRKHAPDFDASRYPSGEVTSLRTFDYRYQRRKNGSDLFELPDETTPVGAERPEVVDRLDTALNSWTDTYGRPTGDQKRTATFTDEMEEQLENLGYL